MKILIIGQAPPSPTQIQDAPYSSTMLYDWLKECGISKEESQKMFIFDAVYNKFPGYKPKGGHKPPTLAQMDEYWNRELETKVQGVEKVWLLGNVAANYFHSKPKSWSCSLQILETMHPSKYNLKRYQENKESIIKEIKQFIWK